VIWQGIYFRADEIFFGKYYLSIYFNYEVSAATDDFANISAWDLT
jgi:hypothetical protein